MNVYHIWCDLRPDVSDTMFSDQVAKYLGHLKTNGQIEGWRLMRRKLGLGPKVIGEFHLMIETRDLQQLDNAFAHVASRRDPVEEFHFHVNSLVQNAQFGLYRDFPDDVRHRGEERF